MPIETRLPMVGRGKLTAMPDLLLTRISAFRRAKRKPSMSWPKWQPMRTVLRLRTVSRVSIARSSFDSADSPHPRGGGVCCSTDQSNDGAMEPMGEGYSSYIFVYLVFLLHYTIMPRMFKPLRKQIDPPEHCGHGHDERGNLAIRN